MPIKKEENEIWNEKRERERKRTERLPIHGFFKMTDNYAKKRERKSVKIRLEANYTELSKLRERTKWGMNACVILK